MSRQGYENFALAKEGEPLREPPDFDDFHWGDAREASGGSMVLSDLSRRKEGFSLAYVSAVAHAAGFHADKTGSSLDDDGVDVQIVRRGPGGVVRSPRLELQVKATAAPLIGDPFSFDLSSKNYEELISTELQVPRILVVVSLPQGEDSSAWIVESEEQLILRHCGYWISLRDGEPSTNTEKVRIRINRSSWFHCEQLRSIMERIRGGGLP